MKNEELALTPLAKRRKIFNQKQFVVAPFEASVQEQHYPPVLVSANKSEVFTSIPSSNRNQGVKETSPHFIRFAITPTKYTTVKDKNKSINFQKSDQYSHSPIKAVTLTPKINKERPNQFIIFNGVSAKKLDVNAKKPRKISVAGF